MNLSSDRSWMAQRKSSTEIGATVEFRAGCQVFLEYAYSHPECVNNRNQIRCPCWKYKNNNYLDRDIVNYHLLVSGFMRNYEECWWAHGQRRDGGYIGNKPGSRSTHRMDEMVHDIAGPNFDWEQAREQPMNSDAKAFSKLLKEADHPFQRNRENFRKWKVENDIPIPRLSGTEAFYIWSSGSRLWKRKGVFLSEKELHAAHNYILINCEEVDEFVRMFDDELKVKHPGITDKDIEINRAKEFARWIKDKALMEGSTIPANVQTLAMGPDMDQISRNGYKVNGYKVNGYEFHTKAYGHGKRTTNSGVCVLGDCYNELSHAFYGGLEEILELSYKGTYSGYINLFKCRWFDSEKGIHVDRHGIVDIDVHTREEVISGEFYQEEILHGPTVINVDDSEVIQLDGEDEPDEIDPALILVSDDIIDIEDEELLIDTDSESEAEEDDGYESIQDDPDSETDT
ncbi:hypothetical protein POM88_018678 [Heracleum sosnowskyi]|uniref:Transposase-associated domain-containing protein n=1 Tax=Heracleum sosnowskyi TaxID=360622 RepID=A0AAD8IRI9_9APIA|nr:hypothetical protein POM88_018678 [Heracleum sosnowskyi]